MGLLDVFAETETNLKQTFKDLVPAMKPPAFRVGEVSKAIEGDYPRIVWVPTTESISMTDLVGRDTSVPTVRPLWARNSRVEAHVWEKDITACEILANHLVAAVHGGPVKAGQWGNYKVLNAYWNTAAVIQRGVVYVLVFEFQFWFTRETATFGLPITEFPLTETLLPQTATG